MTTMPSGIRKTIKTIMKMSGVKNRNLMGMFGYKTPPQASALLGRDMRLTQFIKVMHICNAEVCIRWKNHLFILPTDDTVETKVETKVENRTTPEK